MKAPFVLFAVAALFAADARADARADVFAAFEKAMARQSYRTVATTDTGGRSITTTIDVQLPASFHMKNPDVEVIVLPGATWMNQGGQWMKLPMDMSAMVKNMTVQAMKESAGLVQDVTEEGSETIDGCDATLYRYRTAGKVMGIQADADVQLAICDGLPVRAITSDKGKNRTVVSYDYDAKVDIKAPN
jgi:hypothetical protein